MDKRMESLIDATPQGMQMRKGLDELLANNRISIEMKQQEMSLFRDVVHSEILKMGVPRGFVKNALLLAQYDLGCGYKPTIRCGTCTQNIDSVRDFACNRRKPLCIACA